jgi:hypothetical protein
MEVTGKATRDELQELWGLLLKAYISEMQKPEPPSAAMLNSLRIFLVDNGITKDFDGHRSAEASLAMLSDLSLPFK